MNQIAILAHNANAASFYKDILDSIFQINTLPLSMQHQLDIPWHDLNLDFLLTTSYTYGNHTQNLPPCTLKVIRLQPCLTKIQCDILDQIPPNKEIYFYHSHPELASEHSILLADAGYSLHQRIARRPDSIPVQHSSYVVTTDELKAEDFQENQLVHINSPKISSLSIHHIAKELNLEESLLQDYYQKYLDTLVSSGHSTYFTSAAMDKRYHFSCIIDSLDESILVATEKGSIISMNKSAYRILGIHSSCIQKNVLDVLPIQQLPTALQPSKVITKYQQHFLTIKASPVSSKDFCGFLFTLHSFAKPAQAPPNKYSFEEKGHQAKYTFHDIKGISGDLLRCKDIANQMAKSNSSVLITGESGTGKELFAQAIHNASQRRSQPFVVVNCASISASLLESELFGYVEGAFTGAKQGGKNGLFFLAHQGTVFLDEVAELPLSVQSSLLRVLQEKEIRPVGSDQLISINVRVIAATHQNLDQLVAENKFRLDLYYRLKVLPLHLPALRHRKQDILILFQHMQQFLGTSYLLSEKAKKALIQGNWHGNLRELKNCVEYLAHLEKNYIEVEDLPALDLLDDSIPLTGVSIASRSHCEYFVLKCIYQAMKAQQKIGRRSILTMAQNMEMSVSEQDIRNALQTLYHANDIIIGKGRQGTSLTEKGIETLQKISEETGELG